jgi:O-antigen/teichoic acid export membrane protein
MDNSKTIGKKSCQDNNMIQRLKPESEFSRNVLTLMTGTTIAQAIPIAISPILTRIYSPADFGLFALFIAIASIFGSIANGRYELAIMLPKKDEDAINIFALGFIITSIISISLLILVVIFNDFFTKLLKNEEISLWLYFVPLMVFFTGVWNILNYFNNRKKLYKDIANATIIKSIVLAIVQLSLGFIKQGVFGLITGQIASQAFSNTKLFLNILRDKVLVSKISKVKIIALAKRYKDFPKLSMWGIFANTLSTQSTNILISSLFSVVTLGFYSLVQRVLDVPSALIGGAIGQVFFQEATKEKEKTGKAINSFDKTIKKLLIIGIPSFGVLFFVVEDLFAIVFGEEWRIAGTYAKIVTPLFFIRFVVATVSNINNVFELQKLALLWQVTLLFLSIGSLYFSNLYSLDFHSFLVLFTLVVSLHYVALFFIMRIVSRKGYFL